jgi:outer membrane lipoprotein LolB
MSRTALMNLRARWAAWLASFALALLAGCASPPRATGPVDPVTGPWSGRLALQVQDQASQSFSASFELKGTARSGELALFSPLGGTLAVLAWQPGAATLNSNGRTRQFDSVDALVAHVTGAAIPVAALFDWLRGIDTPVPGWHADLSQLAQGRVAAKRHEPTPEADLRLVLEHQ